MGRSRSRSRSPRRERRRSRSRDKERRRDKGGEQKHARRRRRSRSRSASPGAQQPRRRSRSPVRKVPRQKERRSRSPHDMYRPGEEEYPGSPNERELLDRPDMDEADFDGKTEEEVDMMKIMGFGGFDSTKGKKVDGNNIYVANVLHKRKYRQYMNRRGGFNRPLDFIA